MRNLFAGLFVAAALLPGAAFAGCDAVNDDIYTAWLHAMAIPNSCRNSSSDDCARRFSALICDTNGAIIATGDNRCINSSDKTAHRLAGLAETLVKYQDNMSRMIDASRMKNPKNLHGYDRRDYCRRNGAVFSRW